MEQLDNFKFREEFSNIGLLKISGLQGPYFFTRTSEHRHEVYRYICCMGQTSYTGILYGIFLCWYKYV